VEYFDLCTFFFWGKVIFILHFTYLVDKILIFHTKNVNIKAHETHQNKEKFELFTIDLNFFKNLKNIWVISNHHQYPILKLNQSFGVQIYHFLS
jgi:hypothetical protein